MRVKSHPKAAETAGKDESIASEKKLHNMCLGGLSFLHAFDDVSGTHHQIPVT